MKTSEPALETTNPMALKSSPRESREPTVSSSDAVHSPASPVGSPISGASMPRKTRRKEKETKNGFESVQDVIFESMRETQRMRRSRPENGNEASVFLDTVKDIQTVASGTIASIKQWTKQHTQEQEKGAPSKSGVILNSPQKPVQNEPCSSSIERFGAVAQQQADGGSLLQDLAWPFAICGLTVQARLPEKGNLAPHIDKVKEAVTKAVHGDINHAATGIWKFAAGSKDEDDNTVGTLDTLQEENNQIRRLGSWGTVNTFATGGTADTGLSFEPSLTPHEINLHIMEDDDGNTIDPVLLQKAQQTREKRSHRKEKLVKFDYPPIKSLRQCPRPDPKDLPDLFFTEHELDQIEDDRYSTMSTDDIEIVAVSSKGEEAQPVKSRFKNYKSPRAKHGSQPTFDDSPPEQISPSTVRDQPEIGWKQTRGRNSTPYRRRHHEDDEEADFPTHQSKKSPSNSGRLVKGVQIYLRERSTGA